MTFAPLFAGLTENTRETSLAAAQGDRSRQREQVYDAIRSGGAQGRTDDEVQVLLGLSGHSQCPRRLELWRAGRVAELRDAAGRPVRRRTRTGRTAAAWIANEETP